MFLPLSSDATPWFTWNLDPILWLGIVGLVAAYFYAIGPLRRRYQLGPPVASRQIAYFLLGTLTLAFALVSPLDFIGDHYLFSAHMIQHMLLIVVAPPLWLLGTPGWLLAPLFRREPVRQITRIITNPIVAFLLLNATLYIWHLPPLYDAALTNEALHIVEHLMYITLGVLFWWVVLSPVEEAPRVSRGVAIIYLFLACQPMVLLGALLTFAPAAGLSALRRRAADHTSQPAHRSAAWRADHVAANEHSVSHCASASSSSNGWPSRIAPNGWRRAKRWMRSKDSMRRSSLGRLQKGDTRRTHESAARD